MCRYATPSTRCSPSGRDGPYAQRGRCGYAWLDTGTHASLLDVGNFVRTLEEGQGPQSGSPDEFAFGQGGITQDALARRIAMFRKNRYGAYLKSPIED